MILKLLNDNDEQTKETIRKLQMKRDSGEISDDEYEERYEATMDRMRLRFAMILDGRALESYNTYTNERHT